MKNKITAIQKLVIIYTNSMGEEKEITELDKMHLINAYDKAHRENNALDAQYLRDEIIRRLTVAETKRSFKSMVRE